MSVLKAKRKASQFEVYHDFFYSWFKNHYKIMSRVQRENIENLYKEEVEKWHRTTQSL